MAPPGSQSNKNSKVKMENLGPNYNDETQVYGNQFIYSENKNQGGFVGQNKQPMYLDGKTYQSLG